MQPTIVADVLALLDPLLNSLAALCSLCAVMMAAGGPTAGGAA